MPNIKDVARLAGVSTATVSRTLSAPDSVAESTRERVRQAIKNSGYVANALASNFRRRRSQNVLVLVPNIGNHFFAKIIQGIETSAIESGYRILLGDTQQNPERERAYCELFYQRQVDGVISLGRTIPFEYDRRRKTPDPQWPPIIMVSEYDGAVSLPKVTIDHRCAATEMVQHLVELGHRDIAYIDGPEDSPLSWQRLAGYHQALANAGIPVREALICRGDFTLASGYSAGQHLLARKNRPTALFCANDEMAIGAMNVARNLGLTIPDDLSVAGFDDIEFAAFSFPPLTTVHQPRGLIGGTAMQLMLEMLKGEAVGNKVVVLSHELIIRGTTAEPAR